MSTYLLAFIVSDFNYVENFTKDHIQVCSFLFINAVAFFRGLLKKQLNRFFVTMLQLVPTKRKKCSVFAVSVLFKTTFSNAQT